MDPAIIRSSIPIFWTIALLTAVCLAALMALGGW